MNSLERAKKTKKDYIEKVYESCKKTHPEGCYGRWAWVWNTLYVRCMGCGYIMVINPKIKKLEHLSSAIKSTEKMAEIREYEGWRHIRKA